VALLDLKLESNYVRGKVIEYLNRLVEIGVAGFRVDAAKHMWPGDLQYIYDRIDDLNTAAGFSPHTRPFIFSEASAVQLKFFYRGVVTALKPVRAEQVRQPERKQNWTVPHCGSVCLGLYA